MVDGLLPVRAHTNWLDLFTVWRGGIERITSQQDCIKPCSRNINTPDALEQSIRPRTVMSRPPGLFLLFLGPLLFLVARALLGLAVERRAALFLVALLGAVLALLLGRLLLFLLLPVLDLVLDQVVEGRDGADQTAQVDGHELVVGLDAHGVVELRVALGAAGGRAGLGRREVREQVEHVLEVAQDGVVDGQLAVEDLLEVCLDVAEAEVQALQGLELVGDAGREGADGHVADVAQQVLDADLLGLLGLDDGWCVDKSLGGGGAVLVTQGELAPPQQVQTDVGHGNIHP